MLKDIEDFLDEGARGWYARRGILLKRFPVVWASWNREIQFQLVRRRAF